MVKGRKMDNFLHWRTLFTENITLCGLPIKDNVTVNDKNTVSCPLCLKFIVEDKAKKILGEE